MTHIRTRRPTRSHRITVRFNRSEKATIAALAAFNHVTFNQQLLTMLTAALGK